MDAIPTCFVNEVTESVRVISTGPRQPDKEGCAAEVHQFSTLNQIRSHFSRNEDHDYPWNFVYVSPSSVSFMHAKAWLNKRNRSICQRNSWEPLEITKPMFSFLAETFNLNSSVWDLSSCFYAKDIDIESTFCIPFALSKNGSVTELSYTFRYPEFKPTQGTWVIRQTGIYQKFDTKSCENTSILFSPAPSCALNQKAETILSRGPRNIHRDFFWIHKELFNTYFSAWRLYNVHLEKTLLPIASNAVSSFVEELSETEYHHLPKLAYLEAQKITQLLANTLSFREQSLAKAQNTTMLRLNKSAVFITTLTLLYLPPSFVATFFGMNFFDLDEGAHQIVATPMIWIYVLCSAALTVGTFVFYHILLDRTIFGRVAARAFMLKTFVKYKAKKTPCDVGSEAV
ncbi:zinc transport [Fusarium sporotrichioides]|uniref:Zinc transport n=1 Tax=Fusarium sporotrichioides TaxID=5514 RepID=A0A395SX36_FUSSP|nr:zinc transport [Fusarium sporotrichioides]